MGKMNNNSIEISDISSFFTSLECLPGYFGQNCSTLCPRGYYGNHCIHRCECPDELCNATTGCVSGKGVI